MTKEDVQAFADGLVISKGFTAMPARLEILAVHEQMSEIKDLKFLRVSFIR